MAFLVWRSDSSQANLRRDNSLTYAKADCQTCETLQTSCDRQRPCCGTCLAAHRSCRGYGTNLRWKNTKFTNDVNTPSIRSNLASSTHPKQSVRFVNGQPRNKPKTRLRRSKPATFSIHGSWSADRITDGLSDRAGAEPELSCEEFGVSPQSPGLSFADMVLEASGSPASSCGRADDFSWLHETTETESATNHGIDSSVDDIDLDRQRSMDSDIGFQLAGRTPDDYHTALTSSYSGQYFRD